MSARVVLRFLETVARVVRCFVKRPHVAETLYFPYYPGLLEPAHEVKGNPNYGQYA